MQILINPNGVASTDGALDATPLGLKRCPGLTQGSLAVSATLGFETESLWDSPMSDHDWWAMQTLGWRT